MERSRTRLLLVASLAGALILPVVALGAGDRAKSSTEKVHCYGVNKCKGTGDCGGKGHSCANQNGCKRLGSVEMDKETCLRLDGGRLTDKAKKS